MTGPVIFADETAREQLTTHGEVVTFRTSERTTGKTWWRESRTGPKKGDCYITRLVPVDASDASKLEPFWNLSGFDSVADWQQAIKELNDELTGGYLYRVERMEGSDE